jgi:predicted ATP-dependent endonuclease of OLD family
MRIKAIRIENFRAIAECQLRVDAVTALLGENNSGKSAILRAVELFFSSAPKVQKEDFHAYNVDEPIKISIEFGDLCPKELEEFGSKVIDEKVVITRSFPLLESPTYFIEADVFPGFAEIRSAPSKAVMREQYRAIAQPMGLAAVGNADQIEGRLVEWESNNPDRLERNKISGFFGAENVANGKLRAKTDFVFIPAIKDARDELKDTKSSPVRSLLAGIARQAIENKEEYKAFVEQAEAQLSDLTSPENTPELQDISRNLSEIMERYYANSSLVASWDPIAKLPLSLPAPDVRIHDGFIQTEVEFVGHGMQRAIVLTLLEYMARHNVGNQDDDAFVEPQSDIIIAIEEPELYQHPTKQRLFYKVLNEIAEGFSARSGIRIQIIYATHSPLLVSLQSAERIRTILKTVDGDNSSIVSGETTLEKCAARTADAFNVESNVARFGTGLHVVTQDISEGFFSKIVVLVEGPSDVAILSAYLEKKQRDPLAEGIVIKAVGGKSNLDKPAVIFSELKIPTYVIFDNDFTERGGSAAEARKNRALQAILRSDNAEDWPEGIFANYACWDGDIEKYLRETVGDEVYRTAQEAVTVPLGLSRKDSVKSPGIASRLLQNLLEQGFEFEKLDEIVARIDDTLATPPPAP